MPSSTLAIVGAAAAAALALTLQISEARAHGAFPAATDVLRDPADPQHLVVLTTYGVMITYDLGGEWLWICPEVVEFNPVLEDPRGAITKDGNLLLGVFDGLSRSTPDTCGWQVADTIPLNVVGLTLADDGLSATALTSRGLGGDVYDVRLWSSADGGAQWTQAGTSPPDSFLANSMKLAAGGRIYAAGKEGPSPFQGVIQRSDDGGQTWQRFPVDGTADGATPRVLGVSPSDPDALYVANVRAKGQEIIAQNLMFSPDAGATWQLLLERDYLLPAFALSPDGSEIAVGSRSDGLLVAATSDHTFSQRSDVALDCLRWHEDVMFACADEFVSGFTVGVSADNGQTFSGLMNLSSACGPISCDANSDVARECSSLWETERQELGAGLCDAPVPPPTSSGACGCHIPAPPKQPGRSVTWLLLGLAATMAARRARSR